VPRTQRPRPARSCWPRSGPGRRRGPGHGRRRPAGTRLPGPGRGRGGLLLEGAGSRAAARRPGAASRPGRPGGRPGPAGRLGARPGDRDLAAGAVAAGRPWPPGPRPGAPWWSRAGRWGAGTAPGPSGPSPARTWPRSSCWPPGPPWPPTGCGSCACGRPSSSRPTPPTPAAALRRRPAHHLLGRAPPGRGAARRPGRGRAGLHRHRARPGQRRRGQGRLHRRPPGPGHRLRGRGLPGPRRRPGRHPRPRVRRSCSTTWARSASPTPSSTRPGP
jgi:translation initiation factor IF-2